MSEDPPVYHVDRIIKIPFIGYSTNKIYAGMHWTKRKAQADEAHLIVKIACKGLKSFTERVDIEYTPHVATRMLDTSNYSYACKLIEDGLVKCGILIDDNQKHVGKFTINPPVKIAKGEAGFVEVRISTHTK